MMKLQKFILFLALVLFFAGCSELEENINPDTSAETLNKQKLLDLVNAQRTAGCNCGGTQMPAVKAVVWSDKLEEAAQIHSQDMADNEHFEHTGTDGSSPGDRLTRVGYNWKTYGENIAWNYPDEDAVIQGWIDSPGHCKNIMKDNVTDMAVAKVGDYWTQILATQ